MTPRPRARDFTVGETVKVVGPFSPKRNHLASFVGWFGRVSMVMSSDERIEVSFAPLGCGRDFKPDELERGRVEWIPEGAER